MLSDIYVSPERSPAVWGGNYYAHQVSGDSDDETLGTFQMLHQRLIRVPYEVIFFTLQLGRNSYTQGGLVCHLQIDPVMETLRATEVRNMAQLESARRTRKGSENCVSD